MSNQLNVTETEKDELTARAYEQNPNLPKDGDRVWNYGHEFIVTDARVFAFSESNPCRFSHQFSYNGVCTEDPSNDSIRHTGFNGGRYGYGINVK